MQKFELGVDSPFFSNRDLQKDHVKRLAEVGIHAVFLNYGAGCCTGPTTILIYSSKRISWFGKIVLWFRFRPDYPCYM